MGHTNVLSIYPFILHTHMGYTRVCLQQPMKRREKNRSILQVKHIKGMIFKVMCSVLIKPLFPHSAFFSSQFSFVRYLKAQLSKNFFFYQLVLPFKVESIPSVLCLVLGGFSIHLCLAVFILWIDH